MYYTSRPATKASVTKPPPPHPPPDHQSPPRLISDVQCAVNATPARRAPGAVLMAGAVVAALYCDAVTVCSRQWRRGRRIAPHRTAPHPPSVRPSVQKGGTGREVGGACCVRARPAAAAAAAAAVAGCSSSPVCTARPFSHEVTRVP